MSQIDAKELAMLLHRPLILALMVLLSTVQVSLGQGVGINWLTDFEQAKGIAKASNRLVLLHFWTETCGPCKRLESVVFNQPQVANALNTNFVPVKLNADEASTIAEELGVTRVPTDVIVTPEGQVLARLISPTTPLEYVAKMTRVATAHASKIGSGFVQAAAESPYGPVVNQAYASLNLPPQQNPLAPPAASPTTPPIAPVVPAAPGSTTKPAVTTNPYAAPATPGITPIPPAAPQASVASAPSSPAAAPAGSPPLGFDGHCPVTMKKQWKWQKGDPTYGVIHRGRTYLFAGPAEKDAFFKDPDAYAPVLSGIDPVVALEQGKAVPGQRQFALEYEGQFYLFSSEQTLNRFWADSQRYATGVRQALAAPQTQLR